jgi:hypothetical protein
MRKPIATDASRNRRGCFVLLVVLALALTAFAYIGLGADAVNEVSSRSQLWASPPLAK